MQDPKPWRRASFESVKERDEFLAHLRNLTVEGIEVESLDEGPARIRFRAPARVEVGIAGMISAHGGRILPTLP